MYLSSFFISPSIRALGYPVIDCDKVYRDMLFDDNVINQIKQIIPGAFFNKKIICFKQVGLFFEHNKSLEMKFEEWRQQYAFIRQLEDVVFINDSTRVYLKIIYTEKDQIRERKFNNNR